VNRAAHGGATPALFAAQGGQTLALKALIKAGADVNLAENDGWSPASLAAQNGETDCLLELIAAGADVNLAANDGASPLYIAAQQGQTAALNVLIANGALVDAATRDGATACRAGRHKGDSTSLQRECAARARFGNSTHASRALREMIARPNISRNERETTERGAFEVGKFAPLCRPGAARPRRRATSTRSCASWPRART